MQVGVEQQVDHGDQRGNDQDEDRMRISCGMKLRSEATATLDSAITRMVASDRHDAVDRWWSPPAGAQAEDLDDRGVLLPDAVAGDGAEFFAVIIGQPFGEQPLTMGIGPLAAFSTALAHGGGVTVAPA